MNWGPWALGELAVLAVLAGIAVWIYRGYRKQEPSPGPGRGETTNYSSTTDD